VCVCVCVCVSVMCNALWEMWSVNDGDVDPNQIDTTVTQKTCMGVL